MRHYFRPFRLDETNTSNPVARVLSNSALTTSALFIARLSNALCFLIITWYLGETEAGIYSLALGYALFFAQLAFWGLDQLFTREIVIKTTRLRSLLGFFLTIRSVATIICYGILVVWVQFIQNYEPATKQILLLGGLIVITESMIRFCYAIFNAFEKATYIMVVSFISGILKFAGMGILLIVGPISLIGFTLIIVAASILGLLVGLAILFSVFPRPDLANFSAYRKYYFWTAISFIVTSTASAFELQFDTLLLFHFTSYQPEIAIGTYNAITVIVYALSMIAQGLRSSILPNVSRIHDKPELLSKIFHKTFISILVFTIPIAMTISFFSNKIVEIIYNNRFPDAVPGLQIIIWSFVLTTSSIPAIIILITQKRQNIVFYIQLMAMILNIGVNLYLIPSMGVHGTVWARIISGFCAWILLLICTFDIYRFSPFLNDIVKIVLSFLISWLCLIFLSAYLALPWIIAAILYHLIYGLCILMSKLFNKHELQMFFAMFQRRKVTS